MAQPSATPVTIEVATDPQFAPEIAELAAATFPLACPPHAQPEDIDDFIRANLDADTFTGYLAADTSDVLIARDADGALIGYSLIHHRAPTDPDVAAVVTEQPVTEVSKMYVLPDHHAAGRTSSPARLLMEAAIDRARTRGSVLVWLGVNEENVRAQRFYAKMGFGRVGEKTFTLGDSVEHDYVLTRPF